MSDIAIKFEDVSKQYRLGTIGTGTISHDLNRWWITNIRRKEDPYLKVGQVNDQDVKSTSNYVWALKDIGFEVKPGEVLGIIGKNGAGKSTLLKILSRVTTPTTGRIFAHGRIASLLEVGTGFHPEMTGRENIYMNGSIMGMTKAEITRKLDEIVNFAGVEKYIDTPVKRYSSGMTVRLGFAVAAHLEPDILVIDEVLSVGDAEFQKKAVGKIQDVSHRDGRTVLFVSHNMTAVANICTKLCVLNNGTLNFLGNVNVGIENYFRSTSESSNQTSKGLPQKMDLPNDEDFELIDLQITQGKGIISEFFTSQPIKINFIYDVKRKIDGLRIGFDFIDSITGTILFRTFHDDQSDIITHEKGKFVTAADIPSNLLKPGRYIINIAIGIHNVRWVSFEKISIPISLNNIDGINKQYADNRPGIIMPIINWEKVKL